MLHETERERAINCPTHKEVENEEENFFSYEALLLKKIEIEIEKLISNVTSKIKSFVT